MILPGGTLGVLGGGQLGRMFASEALRMGYQVLVVDPDQSAPAAALTSRHLCRSWADPQLIVETLDQAAGVTIEFENIPGSVLRALEASLPVRPGAASVEITQNRVVEKTFLNQIGVATTTWHAVNSATALSGAWQAVGGVAAILKTAALGYDGKGQAVVQSLKELTDAFADLGGVPAILEQRVDLVTEVSVMVARDASGSVVTWPIAENRHINGILHTSVVPAQVSADIAAKATKVAMLIVNELGYVGVMGVECFVTATGELLVNELAPRPHNSGHWTLDASVTSQFEQQVRIVAGLPLGETRMLSAAAMINLLGDLWQRGEPQWQRALALPGVRLHLYGKQHARPGRKMGHLTVLATTPDAALATAQQAWRLLTE